MHRRSVSFEFNDIDFVHVLESKLCVLMDHSLVYSCYLIANHCVEEGNID